MKALINKSLFTLAVFVLPSVTFAAKDIPGIIELLQDWLGTLVTLVVGVAVLVFIWGLVVFIAKSGDETARAEGKQKMIWGIIAIFVMVSIWGIVSLISSSFLDGANGDAPSAPELPKPGTAV